MRVLVTGGAGFIGSHLVDALVSGGHEVTAVDDLSAGKTANLASRMNGPRFSFIEADFAGGRVLSEAVPKADAVVHLAARVGVADSVKNPELVHATNVTKTLSLLGACAKAGVGRFVLASSAAVYGDAVPPVTESMPTRPLSPYAASKVACEAYCAAYQRSFGLPTVVLRFMNAYGPRAGGAYGAVMSEFARSLESGTPLTVHGDGEQTRDFVHVTDVVSAILLAATNERAAGETFNVGTGVPTSIGRLARMFISAAGKEGAAVSKGSPRPGDVRHSCADISKARRLLGYDPKRGLEEGVAEFLKWHSEERIPDR